MNILEYHWNALDENIFMKQFSFCVCLYICNTYCLNLCTTFSLPEPSRVTLYLVYIHILCIFWSVTQKMLPSCAIILTVSDQIKAQRHQYSGQEHWSQWDSHKNHTLPHTRDPSHQISSVRRWNTKLWPHRRLVPLVYKMIHCFIIYYHQKSFFWKDNFSRAGSAERFPRCSGSATAEV